MTWNIAQKKMLTLITAERASNLLIWSLPAPHLQEKMLTRQFHCQSVTVAREYSLVRFFHLSFRIFLYLIVSLPRQLEFSCMIFSLEPLLTRPRIVNTCEKSEIRMWFPQRAVNETLLKINWSNFGCFYHTENFYYFFSNENFNIPLKLDSRIISRALLHRVLLSSFLFVISPLHIAYNMKCIWVKYIESER